MLTITNFGSGEIEITVVSGPSVRLGREEANRLVMTARMHTVDEFLEKLAKLLPNEDLVRGIQAAVEGKTSTERWNFKEKFARLQTLSKGYVSPEPDTILDKVTIEF